MVTASALRRRRSSARCSASGRSSPWKSVRIDTSVRRMAAGSVLMLEPSERAGNGYGPIAASDRRNKPWPARRLAWRRDDEESPHAYADEAEADTPDPEDRGRVALRREGVEGEHAPNGEHGDPEPA